MAGNAQAGRAGSDGRGGVSAAQPRVTTGRGGSKQRLLETAERMLAEYGIEGVSLRQIGAATGEGNKSVIQYHFGDKAGLIREIILRRVETFEARRQQLLADATAKGSLADTRTLLEILFLPLAEAVDADGRHGYARFMAQFITRFQYQDGIAHPGWAPDSAATRAVTLLAERLPFMTPPALRARINGVSALFLSALAERDAAVAHGENISPESAFLADLFNVMAAALETPLPA
jgi:AcrR family transcriptional regulator